LARAYENPRSHHGLLHALQGPGSPREVMSLITSVARAQAGGGFQTTGTKAKSRAQTPFRNSLKTKSISFLIFNLSTDSPFCIITISPKQIIVTRSSFSASNPRSLTFTYCLTVAPKICPPTKSIRYVLPPPPSSLYFEYTSS